MLQSDAFVTFITSNVRSGWEVVLALEWYTRPLKYRLSAKPAVSAALASQEESDEEYTVHLHGLEGRYLPTPSVGGTGGRVAEVASCSRPDDGLEGSMGGRYTAIEECEDEAVTLEHHQYAASVDTVTVSKEVGEGKVVELSPVLLDIVSNGQQSVGTESASRNTEIPNEESKREETNVKISKIAIKQYGLLLLLSPGFYFLGNHLVSNVFAGFPPL
jgi:hypothetical protein